MTANTPAATAPYWFVNLLVKKYATTPARGPINTGIQKQTTSKDTLVNKFMNL